MVDSELTSAEPAEFREDIYTGGKPYLLIEFEPSEGQDEIGWFWKEEEGSTLDVSVTIQQHGILNPEVLRRTLLNIAGQM